MPQGHPLLSYPLSEPSTLSSQYSDYNTFPFVSVPPAIALKMFSLFSPAPSQDKRLHFSLKLSDNSPTVKNFTLHYRILLLCKQDSQDLNRISCLSISTLFYLVQKTLSFLCGQQPKPSCGSEDHWSPLPLQARHSLLGHFQQHLQCVSHL